MSVISIKDLNLHYGDFHALKSVNMEIPKNEITAFCLYFMAKTIIIETIIYFGGNIPICRLIYRF